MNHSLAVLDHIGTLMEDPTSDLVHITDLITEDPTTEVITTLVVMEVDRTTNLTTEDLVTEAELSQDPTTANPMAGSIPDLAEEDQTADIVLVLEVDPVVDSITAPEADLVAASTEEVVEEPPQDMVVNVKKD